MFDKEKESLLILNAIGGVGNRRISKLLRIYHTAENVLHIGRRQLEHDRIIPSNVISNIIEFPKDKFLENEYNLITNHGVKVLIDKDSDYPDSLRHIPDAPVVLYQKGEYTPSMVESIAIVGSRRASVYGINVANKFGFELAQRGLSVISGLARGIDTAAHKGALRGQGKTVAVLGSGLACMYPRENQKLFEEIVQVGSVLSEFPMEMKPLSYNFPRRNRIVSGLAKSIIVAEAALKSGALITADFALEQGRDVYAVPGAIEQVNAMGANYLIQQGAKLIASVEDVVEDFQDNGIDPPLTINRTENIEVDQIKLSDQEHRLIQYISDRAVNIDQIVSDSKHEVALTHRLLLQLELKKVIKQYPGKIFKRVNHEGMIRG